MIQHKEIRVQGLEFTFSIESANGAHLDLALSTEAADLPDTSLVRFSAQARSGEPFIVRDLSITWSVPAIDMHGWYSGPPAPDELVKLPYWWIRKQVGVNSGFPFIALFHRSGANRFAFGLLDQLTETALDGELVEATRSYTFHWHKPIGPSNLVVEQWEETVFVSAAHRPWAAVLQAYHTRFGTRTTEGVPNALSVAQAYDGTHMLAQAIKKAGSLDQLALRI